MALLPPSSSNDFPKRCPTTPAIALPILVLPVALTSGIRVSAASHSPTSRPPLTSPFIPSGAPALFSTSLTIWKHATAHNGVFSEGFHTQVSPHTQAINAFQLHTATGKL